MQKPDDIPEDVWALAISYQFQEPGLCLTNSQVEPTARAILAEREALEGSIRGLQEERRRMAIDWCDFCEDIGVDVDTHEAVAYQIKCMFDG